MGAGRGRGRGRGGSRGRGGRGGRGSRNGRGGRGQSWFDSSRLAQLDEEAEEDPESDSSHNEEETEGSDSESEAEKQKKQAYQALLEGFSSRASAPASKKRKLDHGDVERPERNDREGTMGQANDGGHGSAHDIDESQSENENVYKIGRSDEDGEKDVDFVDEDEEDHTALGNDAGDTDDEDDDDDGNGPPDPSDAFETHFSAPDTDDVARRLAAIQSDAWAVSKITANDSTQIFYTPQATMPHHHFSPPAAITDASSLKLKQRIAETLAASKSPGLDAVEQKVAPLLFNYHDLLFCERTPSNGESLRRIASLHAVNHVLKTRDRVIKNNEKLAKAARKRLEMFEDKEIMDDAPDDEVEYRDQGFTRPKVLMLLPTRAACARMVDTICSIYRPEQQENRKRFDDAYVDKSAMVALDRPADYRELFDGNDDDMFRLGLKFTRKTIKYFSQFYNSDIILASPLGLRMAMGSDDRLAETVRASKNKNNKKPQTDYDFLSSVELVLMDQAEALLMQNWEHVEHIFAHLNLRPRDSHHEFDISRLRPWYLDEQASFYRQTVAFSAYHSPVLAELFRRFCHNWAGKVRMQPATFAGVVGRLGVRGVKQTFSRFASPAVDTDPDARFDYFIKAVVPALVGKGKGGGSGGHQRGGILVFIPSYLDFVRVRNWFATAAAVANVTFGTVSEYASVSEASRAMSHFLTGRHRVLLYTERAHHFRRHQINGARSIVLYGLPENPLFYTEITGGYLARSQHSQKLEVGQGSVRVLFSQWDAFKLERIVGSERVGPMLRERSDTFVFEEERAF